MNRAWLVTLASAALFVGAAVPMGLRIRDFNREHPAPSFHVDAYVSRTVRLAGFPPLRIDDHEPTAPSDPAASELKITYGPPGNETVRFVPVKRPPVMGMPGLELYDEWVKVLAINEVQRDAAGNPSPKPGSERLMLAVRRTPQGFDAETWGSVRRTEWLFDFHEFTPDGRIVTSTRRWPMANPMHEEAFQKRAAEAAAGIDGRPPDTRLKSLADIPPLAERTVEYFAAMHVIPKLSVPKHKFNDTALGFRTLGWTLPVCMIAGLVFSVAFFFALAGRPAKAAKQPRVN